MNNFRSNLIVGFCLVILGTSTTLQAQNISWPTQGWATAAPSDVGIDEKPLIELDQGKTEVWAGLGFGGQFLIVLPQYDMIGVVNSWNLFGNSQSSILSAFLTALIQSTN